ncbi:MAG: conjugative transfer signal peptidase TraF [Gammaproteobacteria bacterium]|nr:conjugative transfer signal peptidase TraF [Gammaproteobacteria bacterium]
MKRLAAGVAVAGVSALMLGAMGYAAGVRINTTRSIPVGLYWSSSERVEKGAYVLFCPPQNRIFDDAKARGYIGAGFCTGGYGYLMKRVVAAQNDFVSVAPDGVRVNGNLLPLSAPLDADAAGRSMPRYRVDGYTLRQGELLLMSDVTAVSFDGRYYGPIDRSQVVSVIRPVMTW